MLSSPSSFLTPPKFLAEPLYPAHASPRVRFPPPLAFAATTTSSSAETCTNKYTTSSSSYLPNMAAAAAAACTSSPYQVLGISTGATCHEIKSAYRRLARTCHPDVAISTNPKDTSGGGEFMKVHAAYSTLSDPEKRADYDRRINIRRYQPSTASSGFSKYTRKNWETDQCW
ncbi:chaperone protein dnaJ 11, chloroplastic [Quercus suber]|uniref:Chaperone protein dnaj 11 n=1 Tax=Quercus suber TaxID=58331 RepID=A0AAW0LVU3_QUESU|nr:chaperone protein dnaj 11, chloroplastic [Quercus suber]